MSISSLNVSSLWLSIAFRVYDSEDNSDQLLYFFSRNPVMTPDIWRQREARLWVGTGNRGLHSGD